jgi:acyl-coenzyme A synthetase/AMP-(fatty) acid ligase
MQDNKLNLTEYLLMQHASTRAEHIAVLLINDVAKHIAVSYQKLYQDVWRLAAGLQSLALPAASIVCIQAEQVYDLLLLFLAANLTGLVPTPLLLGMNAEEVEYILRDSDAQVFFCLTKANNNSQLSMPCRLVLDTEYQNLKNFPFQEIQATTTANDPAFIFYTSGSSGHPKGVMHAQHAILGRQPSLKNWLTLTADDVVMQTDNLCWTYSMFTGFLDPLLVGATAAVVTASNCSSLAEDKITAEKWLALIEYYRINILASTPDIYNTLVTSAAMKQFNNHVLRQAGAAGAFLAQEVQHQWLEHFDFPIFIALGMSEISTFISTGPQVPYHENRLGKIQPGRKVTILPLDSGIETVAVNKSGMLAIHKDELGFMLGYVGQKKNDSSQYRGDWFLTQDIVKMDAEGYIEYHGRADMLIKVDGGFRVSPIEIENVLKLHADVIDVACSAMLDAKAACDRLVLYIVSRKVNEQAANELYQFLVKHLSDYKIPTYFYFVGQLPLNSRGKVIRAKLSELLALQKYQVTDTGLQKKG